NGVIYFRNATIVIEATTLIVADEGVGHDNIHIILDGNTISAVAANQAIGDTNLTQFGHNARAAIVENLAIAHVHERAVPTTINAELVPLDDAPLYHDVAIPAFDTVATVRRDFT